MVSLGVKMSCKSFNKTFFYEIKKISDLRFVKLVIFGESQKLHYFGHFQSDFSINHPQMHSKHMRVAN